MSTLQQAEPFKWVKTDFLGWAKSFVSSLIPGQRYPVINYRVLEPKVRPFDPGAACILSKLQENRLRELALLEELATHFKTRLDGK